MFDKLQQLNDLRKLKSQADDLQKQLKTIVLTHEKDGLRIKINGAQEFEYIELDGEQRDDIKDALNEAMKKVQKEAAKKMMEMGGGLGGLLGKM